jgi:hypothetical protein
MVVTSPSCQDIIDRAAGCGAVFGGARQGRPPRHLIGDRRRLGRYVERNLGSGLGRRLRLLALGLDSQGVVVTAAVDLVQLGGCHAGDVPARLASLRPAWMLMRRRMNTARRVPQRTITALFDVYSSDLQEGRRRP